MCIQRGFELVNAGDLETLFAEIFHPKIDYSGDPDISILTGLPVEVTGAAGVRDVWAAFFDMFDEVNLVDIELEPTDEDGRFRGQSRMVTRGGTSEVPIEALFHHAWVIEDDRWRYLAAKLKRDDVTAGLSAWLANG
jgi:hypothetical protein